MDIAEIQAMTRNALEKQKQARELLYLKLIERVNDEIESRARGGYFTANVVIEDKGFRDRLMEHYQFKKFRVTNVMNSVTINWEKVYENWLKLTYCEGSHHFEIESKKLFAEMGEVFIEFENINETDFTGVMEALQEIKKGWNSSDTKIFKYNRDTVAEFLHLAGYDYTSPAIPEDNPMLFHIIIFKKKGES